MCVCVCRILLDSASCIDEALADCQTRPETKVKADELEARMKTIKDALSEKCVTSGQSSDIVYIVLSRLFDDNKLTTR